MKKIDLACIIEDDSIHLFLARKHIESSGLIKKLLIYRNGKEAFDSLKDLFERKKTLPQIIFLDINMPIWDGWQFLEEFSKIPLKDKIPIFILTSSNCEDDFKKAEKFELANNYLVKPITKEQITNIYLEM